MMEKIIAYKLYKTIVTINYMVQRYIIINKKMKIKVVLIKKNNRRKEYGRKLWEVGRCMPQICPINDISPEGEQCPPFEKVL